MRYLLILVLILGLVGCEQVSSDIVSEKDNVITTIKEKEIIVEWQENNLHRKFWASWGSDWNYLKTTLLKERPDGYVDWWADNSIWDTEAVKVNASPWRK